MTNWLLHIERRRKEVETAATLGLPIPGTGKLRRKYRCGCYYCRQGRHGLRPYQRPRKGGGKSKRNTGWEC